MDDTKKGTTIDLIRNILKNEMELADDRIFLYNEEYLLPPDQGLWVIVEYNGSKPYGCIQTTFIDDDGDFSERQELHTQEQIKVKLMSFNLEALERKEEVPMALVSIYAKNLMNKSAFKVAPIMPIVDLSELEGGEINYRFDVMLTVLSWYEKIKKAKYYDGVRTKVTVNDGIPDLVKEFDPSIKPK